MQEKSRSTYLISFDIDLSFFVSTEKKRKTTSWISWVWSNKIPNVYFLSFWGPRSAAQGQVPVLWLLQVRPSVLCPAARPNWIRPRRGHQPWCGNTELLPQGHHGVLRHNATGHVTVYSLVPMICWCKCWFAGFIIATRVLMIFTD